MNFMKETQVVPSETETLNLNFPALTVHKIDLGFSLAISEAKISSMKSNEVIIKVQFSTINYKDQLVCAGNPGLVRRYPHVVGIDAGGIVETSNSVKFKPGDKVMVIGTPLGVNRAGGLAEYIKVPAEWVEFVPSAMEVKDTLVFGTAGYTAALAIQKLEVAGLKRNDGPVLVTGATGGVGLTACFLLSSLGYEVHAVSGNLTANEILGSIGVKTVYSRETFLAELDFPMLKARFAAAIDTVGGSYLSVTARQLKAGGAVAVVGMVASEEITLSVMPLILRGVQLIGVNAEMSDSATRDLIWKTISDTVKFKDMSKLYHQCDLAGALGYLNGTNKIKKSGRIVVQI